MDPYIGEIRLFAGNFAPKDWAFCEGQLLPISQNTALFSILGVTYGGDGKVTFALPDLRGRAPLHQGMGNGLSPRSLGEMGGSESVTLLPQQMPAHSHMAKGAAETGTKKQPDNAIWSQFASSGRPPVATKLFASTANTTMAPGAVGVTGGSVAHNNMQPYLAMRYMICMRGVFPPRG